MEFDWSGEQRGLFERVVAFAQAELAGGAIERDATCTFPRDLWQRCADFGVLGWAVPTELGGAGHSVTTAAYLMEALGYGCEDNGLTFGIGAQMWGVMTALGHFGSDAQKDKYLGGSMDGSLIAAYGITEEGSGSDAFGLEATARRDGDSFVLNGTKIYITFAPIADYAIVFAKTRPDAGRWGISAFLVDADTPGFVRESNQTKMGLRTIPYGSLRLEDCRVPADCLLGAEGSGASLFSYSQGWERSLVLAPQLGAMQRQLEACIAHARGTSRAGTPIGKHQAVSHRIADMKLRLELARLMLYKTAWLQEDGRPNLMEAALTKVYLSEAFTASSQAAIAVHGGAGYATQTGVERSLRDALGGTIYGGTVDIQRNIVSGLLGL